MKIVILSIKRFETLSGKSQLIYKHLGKLENKFLFDCDNMLFHKSE